MLDGCRLDDVELGVRLSGDPPVAHVSVFRSVYLSDRLLLDGDALHRLDRHDRRHSDAATSLDRLAERLAVYVMVDDVRYMLLLYRLYRESELVADSLAGVPGI